MLLARRILTWRRVTSKCCELSNAVEAMHCTNGTLLKGCITILVKSTINKNKMVEILLLIDDK